MLLYENKQQPITLPNDHLSNILVRNQHCVVIKQHRSDCNILKLETDKYLFSSDTLSSPCGTKLCILPKHILFLSYSDNVTI